MTRVTYRVSFHSLSFSPSQHAVAKSVAAAKSALSGDGPLDGDAAAEVRAAVAGAFAGVPAADAVRALTAEAACARKDLAAATPGAAAEAEELR